MSDDLWKIRMLTVDAMGRKIVPTPVLDHDGETIPLAHLGREIERFVNGKVIGLAAEDIPKDGTIWLTKGYDR